MSPVRLCFLTFALVVACGESSDPQPQAVDGSAHDDAGPDPGDAGSDDDDSGATQPGDGGSPDVDAAVPDAGGKGDPDANVDEDAGGDEDAGSDDDAGTDAGPDPFACPEPAVAVDPSELPRAFPLGATTLTITALSASANFTLCEAPAAGAPGARVGSVYFLASDAASFTAEVSLNLSAAGDAVKAGGGAIAAVVLDAFDASGNTLPVAEPVLDLTQGVAKGTLSQAGFFGFRHVDESATYAVTHGTTKASYLTGEVIALGVRLAVVGAPSDARTAELTVAGCNVEPVGPEGAHSATDCGDRETIHRAAHELPNAGNLSANSTLDLLDTDDEPRFFCPFPGQGEVTTELALMRGTTRDLTVRLSGQVLCSQQGLDIVAFTNRYVANRLLHGPAFVSRAPYGVPTPHEEITFMSDAYAAGLEAFGDGVRYLGVTGERSQVAVPTFEVEAPDNVATFTASGVEYTASYTEASLPSREPAMDPNDIEVAYFPPAGGVLTVTSASGSLAVSAPGLAALELAFTDMTSFEEGASNDDRAPLPRVSFADGSAEYVYIRGLVREENGEFGPDGFVRWLRARDLPLEAGRRSFDLMTREQWETAGTTFNLTHLRVGFLNVVWDEERALWPNGRVVPVAGGVMLEGSVARLRDDIELRRGTACPTEGFDEPHSVTGCRIGPREVLLVASGGKIEMFDPFDGSYEGTFIEAGPDAADGFIQIAQNWEDRCLYAAQKTSSGDIGIWRYNHLGEPLSSDQGDPYIQDVDVVPAGLMIQGHVAFIGNELGGVLLWNTRSNVNNVMLDFDNDLRVGSVITDPIGNLYYTAGLLGGPLDRIRTIDLDDFSIRDWLTEMTQPGQINQDAADFPNMLIALPDEHAVQARRFADQVSIRTVDDVYTTDRPIGVHPLLNDRWLVAGEGLGVDVLMPGTHVRTKADTPVASDSGFITSVCLPE